VLPARPYLKSTLLASAPTLTIRAVAGLDLHQAAGRAAIDALQHARRRQALLRQRSATEAGLRPAKQGPRARAAVLDARFLYIGQ
jgi:hypothetical protein